MLDLALRNPTVHLHTHGWLLRREICNERFNESLRLGEDGEWMMLVLRGAKTVSLAQVNTYCYHLRADSAVHSAADVVREYLRTLTAAQPTLNYLDMPDAAAQYRLMHLLLMLTHGVVQEGGFRDGLRQCGNVYCNSLADVGGERQKWIGELILSVAGQSYGKQQTAEY